MRRRLKGWRKSKFWIWEIILICTNYHNISLKASRKFLRLEPMKFSKHGNLLYFHSIFHFLLIFPQPLMPSILLIKTSKSNISSSVNVYPKINPITIKSHSKSLSLKKFQIIKNHLNCADQLTIDVSNPFFVDV